jgi:type I thyroxine 5'-deiodinase
VIFSSPKTFDERMGVATACVRDLGIEFPALLDGIDDSTEKAYTGWPDRLYVIDHEGRVAYKSDPGPFGFTPGGMEEALKKVLEGAEGQASLSPDQSWPARQVDPRLPETAWDHERKP